MKPGPASSKKADHFVDSSLLIPTEINIQEETVFVDVGKVNDVNKKRQQHVDNNNKAKKRKNPFFVREKHWDDDDVIIIL